MWRHYDQPQGGVRATAWIGTSCLIDAFTRWTARGDRRGDYRLITGTWLDLDFAAGAALPPKVQLLGYVKKAELPGLYAGAAAFLYPGIYE